MHGQAAQRFRDLPSSHPRALQPREERDVRGRAPHPYEMIDVWAIASARGEGTVSARSIRARSRARGTREGRATRSGSSRRHRKASRGLRRDDRSERPHSRVVRPPEATQPHSRMNASSPGHPADCRAHRVPETRAKTHLRVVPTAPRTAPGRASPDASAKRSLGAAPPVPRPHRTSTSRTCARAPRRARPRFRPWFGAFVFPTALHGIPSRPFTRPTP